MSVPGMWLLPKSLIARDEMWSSSNMTSSCSEYLSFVELAQDFPESLLETSSSASSKTDSFALWLLPIVDLSLRLPSIHLV